MCLVLGVIDLLAFMTEISSNGSCMQARRGCLGTEISPPQLSVIDCLRKDTHDTRLPVPVFLFTICTTGSSTSSTR
jgi:hypothetical protein